jgi:hypothetical protein
VDRRILVELVDHLHPEVLPLAKANERGGKDPVEGDGMAGTAANLEVAVADAEGQVLAGERRHLRGETRASALRPSREEAVEPKPYAAKTKRTQQGAAVRR